MYWVNRTVSMIWSHWGRPYLGKRGPWGARSRRSPRFAQDARPYARRASRPLGRIQPCSQVHLEALTAACRPAAAPSGYPDDHDRRIPDPLQPLFVVGLVLDVEQDAHDAGEVKPVSGDLVRDRLQARVRSWALDLDRDVAHDDVRPRPAALLLDRDAFAQLALEKAVEFVLVADLSVELLRGMESLD